MVVALSSDDTLIIFTSRCRFDACFKKKLQRRVIYEVKFLSLQLPVPNGHGDAVGNNFHGRGLGVFEAQTTRFRYVKFSFRATSISANLNKIGRHNLRCVEVVIGHLNSNLGLLIG